MSIIVTLIYILGIAVLMFAIYGGVLTTLREIDNWSAWRRYHNAKIDKLVDEVEYLEHRLKKAGIEEDDECEPDEM